MQSIKRLSEDDDDKVTAFGHPYEQNIMLQFYRDGKMLWSSDKTLPSFAESSDYSGFGNITVAETTGASFN